MDEFHLYLVKVSIAQVVLFLIYHLFLRRGTHFVLNRFFLLTGIIIPFIIPLLQLHTRSDGVISIASAILEQVHIGIETEQALTSSVPSFLQLIVAVYLAGLIYLMCRYARQFMIIKQIHKNSVLKIYNGYNIRVTKERVAACSFFKNIYLDDETFSLADVEKILLHEKMHIRQFHSIDIIIAELHCLLLWFNPFSWKLKGALKEVHEYLADAGVRESDPDTSGYFKLLVHQSGNVRAAFLNQFNQSLTLKRIKMMTKNRSGRFAPIKALLGIPVLAFLVITFSGHNRADAFFTINETPITTVGMELSLNSLSGNMDTYGDTLPQYPGGQDAMMKFLKENLQYPETARKAGTEGVVYVQFIITSKGTVTDVKVKRSVEATIDAEVIRVVSMMPNWIPGKIDRKPVDTEMVLPVNFKLEKKK